MGNGELTLRNTPITNTSGGLGGAVFVGAFAKLTFEGGEIEDCRAGVSTGSSSLSCLGVIHN